MIRSYIALGSNLGDPSRQLADALEDLAVLPGSLLIANSPAYRSVAVGPGPQPDYLNAVAVLDTTQPAHSLLRHLQSIEAAHGRVRTERWAARTLDLDILLYGNERIESDSLTVPHPRLRERNFVLYPLYAVAPGLILPCGTSLESLLAHCPADGLEAAGESCGTAS